MKDHAHRQGIGTYGIHSDSKNNLWLLEFPAGNIGKIDAQTKSFEPLTPPPSSRIVAAAWTSRTFVVRRILRQQDRHVRHQDRGDQGMGAADAVVGPYDAVVDKNGEIWTGGMTPIACPASIKTGENIEYLLPGHQHPPRLRGQHDDAGHVLDRQQSRRLDRQGRAAGLTTVIIRESG